MTQQMLGHRNDLTCHFQAAADDQRFPPKVESKSPSGASCDPHSNFHASSCRAQPGYIPPHLCRAHLSIICYNTDVSIVSYDE